MRNSRRSFVTALTVLASLILFIGSLAIGEHSMAQNPKPTTPEGTSQNQQTCEELKRQIKELQDALAEETRFIEQLQQALARAERGLANATDGLKFLSLGPEAPWSRENERRLNAAGIV